MSPVEWGVWFEPTQPVRRLVELAGLAESLGATTCFVADEGTERDVYVALTAIVEATDLIVGPAITNPFSRHPVATAAAIATLAELAPGRVIHGLGVGGSRVIDPLGVDASNPYTALRETLEHNRRLLAGETVDGAALGWFDGQVPVAVAGRGPRVQRLAAERADWIILSAKPLGDLTATAAQVRSRGSARIAWSAYLAYNAVERRRVLRHFSYMAVDAPADIRAAFGLDDATADRVRDLMLRGLLDEAAALLPEAMVDLYGVAGAPDEIAAAIGAHRAHFDLFMLPMNDEASSADHIRRGAEILTAA